MSGLCWCPGFWQPCCGCCRCPMCLSSAELSRSSWQGCRATSLGACSSQVACRRATCAQGLIGIGEQRLGVGQDGAWGQSPVTPADSYAGNCQLCTWMAADDLVAAGPFG